MNSIRWECCEDSEVVALTVTERIEQAAEDAIAARGRFALVLAGGTTPRRVYSLLAGRSQAWDKWCLYYGDERCLPVSDAARNSRMVEVSGLAEKVARHFPMPAELGAEAGAAAYEPLVSAALPFDMVLLGMGEDGHTASLFPGMPLETGDLVIPVHDAPKPPPDRISLSLRALSSCRSMAVMVTGGGKAEALRRWRQGARLPVAEVAAATPEVAVITDLPVACQ